MSKEETIRLYLERDDDMNLHTQEHRDFGIEKLIYIASEKDMLQMFLREHKGEFKSAKDYENISKHPKYSDYIAQRKERNKEQETLRRNLQACQNNRDFYELLSLDDLHYLGY